MSPLWELSWTFFKVGALSFGGGYAILKVIMFFVVESRGWLSLGEFADVVSISQSTPGPIGINAATFVGYKVLGVWGALAATLSSLVVPASLSFAAERLIRRWGDSRLFESVLGSLSPVLLAMLISAGWSLKDAVGWGYGSTSVFLVVFALSLLKGSSPLALMLLGGLVGLLGGLISFGGS